MDDNTLLRRNLCLAKHEFLGGFVEALYRWGVQASHCNKTGACGVAGQDASPPTPLTLTADMST